MQESTKNNNVIQLCPMPASGKRWLQPWRMVPLMVLCTTLTPCQKIRGIHISLTLSRCVKISYAHLVQSSYRRMHSVFFATVAFSPFATWPRGASCSRASTRPPRRASSKCSSRRRSHTCSRRVSSARTSRGRWSQSISIPNANTTPLSGCWRQHVSKSRQTIPNNIRLDTSKY